MKKNIAIILALVFTAFDLVGYRNIEIKNLASKNIYIEGSERVCEKTNNGMLECQLTQNKYTGDSSISFGLSLHAMGSDHSGINKEKLFQEFYEIKVYYKSKNCLIFQDRNPLKINDKYLQSLTGNNVLIFTNNGLELITKEEYEAKKNIYTINDKNVKCIKNHY